MADAPRWTERILLDRLRARHARVTGPAGNGPQWAYMEHVRSHSGFDAQSTIDALAIHLWRSKQHEVHAFEVKVSRADFRRELAEERAKSAIWREWVEFFWIVAPDNVVPKDELPEEFGLLVTWRDGLRVVKQAPRLREKPQGWLPCEPIPRPIVASLLRAAVKTAERTTDSVVEQVG
jgi:hypothetical protein